MSLSSSFKIEQIFFEKYFGKKIQAKAEVKL
jgi:hypothetical protein